MSEETRTVKYDDGNYQQLMDDFTKLSTYEAVSEWDRRAKVELERITEVLQVLETGVQKTSEALEQAKNENAQRPFFKRVFGNKNNEIELSKAIGQSQKAISKLEDLAFKLQEAIDFTPDSAEENKNVLKELRLRKKELQTEKREVAAKLKTIRADARVQSVNAGKGFLGIYNAKRGASERRQIRYEKEAALRPNESEKATIERQLIQVEKDIIWLERFHNNLDKK